MVVERAYNNPDRPLENDPAAALVVSIIVSVRCLVLDNFRVVFDIVVFHFGNK